PERFPTFVFPWSREIALSDKSAELLRISKLGFGESGIRTHGRVSPTHAFQACSFNHSDISPFRIKHLRTARNSVTQNPPSIPSVLPSGLESAAYKTHINS